MKTVFQNIAGQLTEDSLFLYGIPSDINQRINKTAIAARPIVWLLPYIFDGEILRSGVHLARYRVEMFFLEPTKLDNTTDQKFTAIWADMEALAVEFLSRLNIYLDTLPRGGKVERYTIAQAPPEQLFDAMLTGVNVTVTIETQLDVNYCRPFYDEDGFPYTLPLTFSA